MAGMAKKWETLKSERVFSAPFFSLKRETCRLRSGRIMPSYYVMDFSHWVQVIPLTAEKKVLMLRQYRHSLKEWFWEFPGGAVDPKDRGPLEACQRELLEETGFQSEKWRKILSLRPNPAIQSNALHVYIAFGCRQKQLPSPEPFEDMECRQLPLAEWEDLIKRGEITHALMSASLHAAIPLVRKELRQQ